MQKEKGEARSPSTLPGEWMEPAGNTSGNETENQADRANSNNMEVDEEEVRKSKVFPSINHKEQSVPNGNY